MGLFSKLGGKTRGSTQNKFMKVLDNTDLGVGNTTCTLTQWYKFGTGYTVPAQQMIRFGYGTPELPDNQGYLYVHAADGAADFIGKVRLVQSNAQETIKYVVAEFNVAATHGSLTNKAMMIALPEQTQFPMVGEDSLIWLELFPTTAGDIALLANSTVYIPVTIYM